jgi:hypothetical protein
VQQQNCLGIYLAKNSATAVLTAEQVDKTEMLDCFTVSTDPDQESNPAALAPLIAQKLAQKDHSLMQVYLTIDCAMYAQHSLHSEFTDYKQIAGTIKFDAEEIVTTDATQLAVAFQITNANENGSDITIFTADRQLLTNILTDFQTVGLDPILIEPDIVCLARFLRQNIKLTPQQTTLFAILAQKSCYIIIPHSDRYTPLVRSFLIAPGQNITQILARQIPITIASQNFNQPLTDLLLAGDTHSIDPENLTKTTGLKTQIADIAQILGADPAPLEKCPSIAHPAIACGAATAETAKTTKADFREDFAPYQGRKRIMQKALRVLSVSLTILLIAVGAHFQLQVLKNKNYTKRLEKRAAADYSDAMYGRNPPAREPIVSKLQLELLNAKKIQAGLGPGDDNSPPAKLTFILEAVNNVPKNVDLKITDISITQKTMRITGDTNSRQSTLELFNAVKKHPKLKKSHENLSQKGNRDTFIINLELVN